MISRLLATGMAAVISLLAWSCGPCLTAAGEGVTAERTDFEVLFSTSNQDMGAPLATMKVTVDGKPLIFGPSRYSEDGDYTFFSTRIGDKSVRVRAVSEWEGELIEAAKTVRVKDRLWVVITRLVNMSGDPEVKIEISYEVPGAWKKASADVVRADGDNRDPVDE